MSFCLNLTCVSFTEYRWTITRFAVRETIKSSTTGLAMSSNNIWFARTLTTKFFTFKTEWSSKITITWQCSIIIVRSQREDSIITETWKQQVFKIKQNCTPSDCVIYIIFHVQEIVSVQELASLLGWCLVDYMATWFRSFFLCHWYSICFVIAVNVLLFFVTNMKEKIVQIFQHDCWKDPTFWKTVTSNDTWDFWNDPQTKYRSH